MTISDQKKSGKTYFNELYITYTDIQILDVLKFHKDYQSEAVDAAVKIAIERELIHSEQDLLAPEFQNRKKIRLSLFPELSETYQNQKLAGSIFRFLYVMSFIPVVYGFLKYGEGQLDQTFLGVGIGVVWFLLCLILKKSQKQVLIILLIVVLVSVSLTIGAKMVNPGPVKMLDLVMLFIGTLLPFYMLVLLKRLIQQKPE